MVYRLKACVAASAFCTAINEGTSKGVPPMYLLSAFTDGVAMYAVQLWAP